MLKLIIAIGIFIIFTNNCSYAISQENLKSIVINYEKKYNIPSNLLWSIAKVESRTNHLALHIAGKSYFPKTFIEAEHLIEVSINKGITNIDIGLMQINLKYHGKNFKGIHEMLEIDKNLNYAAILLCNLYKIHGDWQEAVQHYHSSKPKHHLKYVRKVLITWDEYKYKA